MNPALQALRCTFVHAPDPVYADTQNYGAQFMPLWAYTLAAHIPDDGRYQLSLCDTRFDQIDHCAEADVFLFSGINQDYSQLLRTLQRLRSQYPRAKYLIGGPITWSFDQAGDIDKLDAFDHIFIGDGEDTIGLLLEQIASDHNLDPIIRNGKRFSVAQSKPLHRELLDKTIGRYYGAVLEVSRGCPFLCEFCDIRVLPDNNRPHNLPPELIVREIDHLYQLGVKQVLLACDNFIGDPKWAEEVVDGLLEWQARTGSHPNLYTWLTINLCRYPELMKKMRRAGFDMLFIGVESFNAGSLNETAKVQNSTRGMVGAVREIQAYGFVIVAGLIFGFDSDQEDCFDLTLDGLKESGLLSGDPSLLTALPGTPLYRRMQLSGRLREVRYGLGGYKYQTNIKYLLPRSAIIEGYRHFVRRYNSGEYQYARLGMFLENLGQGGRFVPLQGTGYGDLPSFMAMVVRNRRAVIQLMSRIGKFLVNPGNAYYVLKGLILLSRYGQIEGRLNYFQFWLFAWSNSVLKYSGLADRDFDIDSVGPEFKVGDVIPKDYAATADEPISRNKIDAQLRATVKQLTRLKGAEQALPTLDT